MTAEHGRHSAPARSHTVEGTDPRLHVESHDPGPGDAPMTVDGIPSSAVGGAPASLPPTSRPVLLLHGFASSAKLNWSDTGWLTALAEAGRRVITVDLPGHGLSAAPEDLDSYSPSRIRADLLQIVADMGVRPLAADDGGSGLDVVGYSLGSRLAWEFGATQPELVHRMVLGGPGAADPLAAFDVVAAQRYLADGTPIADQSTAQLLRMALSLPHNNIFALLSLVEAIKAEPFTPSEAVPRMPMLLVAGDQDDRAATLPELTALAPHAEQLVLAGRDHINAVTSRAFKDSAIAFLAG